MYVVVVFCCHFICPLYFFAFVFLSSNFVSLDFLSLYCCRCLLSLSLLSVLVWSGVFSNNSHFHLFSLLIFSVWNWQFQRTTFSTWFWWIKILQMMTSVKMGQMKIFPRETQIMKEKNQSNATIVTLHPFMQAVWGLIWKYTERKTTRKEKSLTFAASVTSHHLMEVLWRLIWKYRVEKNQTNATNVTMPPLGQAIWGHIWKRMAEKSKKCSQWNLNMIMPLLRQAIWGDHKFTIFHADAFRRHTKR